MPRRSKPLTDPPDALSPTEKAALVKWLYAEIEQKRLPRHFGKKPKPRQLLDECFDWHRMNGKQRCDWPATVRNWFRKAAQFERERKLDRAELYRHEHPQEPRDPGDGDLRLIFGGKR